MEQLNLCHGKRIPARLTENTINLEIVKPVGAIKLYAVEICAENAKLGKKKSCNLQCFVLLW